MIFYNLIMPGPILIPIDSVYLYQTVIKCLLRKRKSMTTKLNLRIMNTAHYNRKWVILQVQDSDRQRIPKFF